MKINMSNHLAIGFQPYWLKKQGLSASNLLEILYQDCVRQRVDVVGITSEERLPITGVHDRFAQLVKQIPQLRDKGYQIRDDFESWAGESMFSIRHPEKKSTVLVLKGQTIQALGPDGTLAKPHNILLFGNREYVSSGLDLYETLLNALNKKGLVIAENPSASLQHEEEIRKHPSLLDAIVVYDGQQGNLKRNQQLAQELNLPYVAIGNQHSPSGRSAGISIPHPLVEAINSKKQLIDAIKRSLETRDYQNDCERESFANEFSWKSKFFFGTLGNNHNKYN